MVKSYRVLSLLCFLIFSISLVFIGCSNMQSQKEESQIYEKQVEDKELTNKQVIDENLKIDENPISNKSTKNLDPITKLAIGQSTAQVQEMFGNKFERVNAVDTNEVMWRFDFTQNNDYKFVPREQILQNMNMDVVDLDGLLKGIIDSQLFIKFDDKDKVSSFSYFYKGNDSNIYARYMFEDGTTKEERI